MNPVMINNLNRKKKLVFCGGKMRSQSGPFARKQLLAAIAFILK
jgi:hypothetical protein